MKESPNKAARGSSVQGKYGKGGKLGLNQSHESGGGLSKQDIENLIARAVNDATDFFNLERSNAEAEKLAYKNQVRSMMQDLVAPLVDQGIKHKEQFVHNISELNDHKSRLEFIEFAMFKSDKKEDRFEELFRKIAEMEQKRT